MPKYYAVCGSQSLVITAPSAEHAAMRLVDEAMAPHAWIYTDTDLDDRHRHDHLVLEALLHLDSSVRVSERGLGRDDAGTFEVPEILDQWHQLMIGMRELFVAAGLSPRDVLPHVVGGSQTPKRPR